MLIGGGEGNVKEEMMHRENSQAFCYPPVKGLDPMPLGLKKKACCCGEDARGDGIGICFSWGTLLCLGSMRSIAPSKSAQFGYLADTSASPPFLINSPIHASYSPTKCDKILSSQGAPILPHPPHTEIPAPPVHHPRR